MAKFVHGDDHPMRTGLLRGECQQVPLDGYLERQGHFLMIPVTEQAQKTCDDPGITTAMGVVSGYRLMDLVHSLISVALTETGHSNLVLLRIPVEFTFLADDADGAETSDRIGMQREIEDDSIVKLGDDTLMVHDGVVASENASAILLSPEGLKSCFLRVCHEALGHGPHAARGPQVERRGEIRARCLDRTTIGASCGCTGGGVSFKEKAQRPNGRDLLDATVHKPCRDVHIMAALGQYCGPRLIDASPVATHIAVREVPEGHILDHG